MKRIKELNYYEKGLLPVLIAMMVIFTVAYPVLASRTGLVYDSAFLGKSKEEADAVFTGNVRDH